MKTRLLIATLAAIIGCGLNVGTMRAMNQSEIEEAATEGSSQEQQRWIQDCQTFIEGQTAFDSMSTEQIKIFARQLDTAQKTEFQQLLEDTRDGISALIGTLESFRTQGQGLIEEGVNYNDPTNFKGQISTILQNLNQKIGQLNSLSPAVPGTQTEPY